MPRVISFIVLLAILLLIGAMFFKVIVPFVVPLFLASVLVVVFQPLHQWLIKCLPGRLRITALLTTLLILLVVLLPMAGLGLKAYSECQKAYHLLEEGNKASQIASQFESRANGLLAKYEAYTGKTLNTEELIKKGTAMIGHFAFSGVQTAFGVLFGLAIMIFALYYFLADGPAMVETVMQLSPLDDEYEMELLDRFGDVSRAVVIATLLSAVVQGLLAGIGYFFMLPSAAPIVLLTVLTMVLAIVPFVGAAAIWVPVCVWLYFFGPVVVDGTMVYQGNWPHALGLTIYCATIVSMVDNVIKPLVLHGQSNLHPLLALLSVIGGVQALGPIGILVGPMLVSFLQALLNMLRKELEHFGSKEPETG